MNDLGVLFALASASWVMRTALLVFIPASRLPRGLRAGLEHVPASVLAAIAVVDLTDAVRADTERAAAALAAGAVVIAIAWRSRNVLLTSGAALGAVGILDVLLA